MEGDPRRVGTTQTGPTGTRQPVAQRRRPRLLFWAGAAFLAVSSIYVVITAVRLVFVYRDVLEAKASLLAMEAALRQEGLAVPESSLATAESQALAAQSRFRSAQRFLEGEPLLRLARRLPWLGSQVEAAGALADIGYEGSAAGLEGIEVLRTFEEIRTEGTATLGERAVAFLDAARPQMSIIEQRLASMRERRSDLDAGLLPPLASLAAEVDERLSYLDDWVKRYRSADAVAGDLLGYRGARTYLVLGQDNTELMPGGGLLGVYGLVTLDRGKLTERVFTDVGDAIDRWQAESGGEYIEPPGPLKRYLLRDWTWNLAVSNWSPDFPTAARQALFFLERGGEPTVDGVIAMDFTTLEGLLAVLGPLTIADYGVTVSAANVTEETLIRTRTVVRSGEKKHDFALAVASQAVDAALAAGQEEWVPLLETLDRLVAGKHIAVYTRAPALQKSLRELGWSGEVLDGPGDYLRVVEASVHSTKLNLVVEQRVEVEVGLDSDGHARNRVTLLYENQVARWAQGRDPQIAHDLMLSGFYGDYVRLLAPPQASLTEVRLNGEEVGIEEIGLEAGKASFGRYLPLPWEARAALAFNYEVPAAVTISKGVYEYRLLVQKQAGTRAIPLSVSISLPAGASLQTVILDGERLNGRALHIEATLDRDRELVVRYRE